MRLAIVPDWCRCDLITIHRAGIIRAVLDGAHRSWHRYQLS